MNSQNFDVHILRQTCNNATTFVTAGTGAIIRVGDNSVSNTSTLYVNESCALNASSGGEIIVEENSKIKILADAEMNVGVGGTLTLEPNSTVEIELYANLNISGTIEIKQGAKLIIHGIVMGELPSVIENNNGEIIVHGILRSHGEVKLDNGGLLDLKEDSYFTYFPTCEVTLEGANSRIELAGTIKVKYGSTFEVLHPNDVSGYIHATSTGRFIGSSTGPKSRVKLIGDNQSDLLLTGTLNMFNNRIYTLKLEDCKVQAILRASHRIFHATNVKFEDGRTYSSNYTRYYNCDFVDNNVSQSISFPYSGKFYAKYCNFHNSQLQKGGSSFYIRYCNFNHTIDYDTYWPFGSVDIKPAMLTYDLVYNSHIYNCHFSGFNSEPNSIINPKVGFYDDNSNVLIRFIETTFSSYDYGVIKNSNGDVRLKCSNFHNNQKGVYAGNFVKVFLDQAHQSGYNHFTNNDIGIELNQALTLELDKGYNDFSGNYPDNIFEGTITGNGSHPCYTESVCAGDYPNSLIASKNSWVGSCNTNNIPANANYDLRYYDSSCSPNNPWCNITIEDPSPFCKGQPACGAYDIVEPPRRKNFIQTGKPGLEVSNKTIGGPDNPFINTSSFADIALDSALVYSIMQMTYIDSAYGDNLVAINLLHEVMTSGLDRSNADVRLKMDWAQDYMKIALEDVFSDSINSDSTIITSFEPPTQQYVDVLNVLTDTLVNDSNYRSQFYLEIDKAQFFRLIGNLEMSYQLAGQIGTCDIDSLEQNLVNNWLSDLQLEMYPDSLINDSIPFTADTTMFTIPEILINNEFFFGSIIESPNQVTYNPCQVSLKNFAFTINTLNSFNVYPNPNRGDFVIQNKGGERQVYIILLDENGRKVQEANQLIEANGHWKIHLTKPARGMYSLQIITDTTIENHRLVIE